MQSVQRAVDSFREAALLPQRWPAALQSLAEALFSEGATVILRDGCNDEIVGSHTLCPVLPEYRRMPFADSRRHIRLSLEHGFMPDYAHFSRSEIAVDPYYQEFLRPRGWGCHAVASLLPSLDISLKRSMRRDHYDGAELRLLNKVLPSLRSASRIVKLSWQSHFSGQLSAFERLGRGALLLTRQARVLHTNGCVRFGDGFDTSHGVLTLSRQTERQRLERFLTAVLHPHESRSVADETMLVVARPSGRRPWVIDGISCTDALGSLHSDAVALLLISELEQTRDFNPAKLMQVFGLTARESELALQIGAGRALKCAAAKLGISEQHARQRLKAIYKKTNTSGQGELTAVIARL